MILVSISENLLGRLNHILFQRRPSRLLQSLPYFAIPLRHKMTWGNRRDRRERHIRTIGSERDAGFGGAEGECLNAAVEDGGLNTGGFEGLGEATEGE